jgi:hypothetical protein
MITFNDFIDIIEKRHVKDADGFGCSQDIILASVRANKTRMSQNEVYSNNAVTARQMVSFKFRVIPGLTVKPSMFITDTEGRYNIVDADSITGGRMYMICTATLVEPSEG